MSKRLLCCLILCTAALFLGACDQINTLTDNPSVAEITNAPFYTALQATVLKFQLPVLFVGVITLIAGWKLGRFGLAFNGFVIGSLILYTALTNSEFISDPSLATGISIGGGVMIGLLTYFLSNLMALIIGGAIGMFLMNGAWLQFAENLPPAVLVFIITFVSALVMFVVFRLFMVAFSAVIGAAVLMLAVPFETLWIIPVAAAGIAVQTGIALWLKDEIFQNLRGDLGAAVGEAFGEVLGPFATLRDRQRGDHEKSAAPKKVSASPEPAAKPVYQAPPPERAAPRQEYRPAQPEYKPPQAERPAPRPAQPQQVDRPAPRQEYQPPVDCPAPRPAQSVQPPQQPAQPGYTPPQYQSPQPAAPVPPYNPAPPTQPNPQVPVAFRPEDYQLTLSNGESYPLVSPQMNGRGRNIDANIVVNDGEVSGTHLIFGIQADGVIVWDNNSTNGTLLNGMPLTGWHRLTTSDVIKIGAVVVRLMRR